ncbi:MAG TPA: phosphate-starvation-inducible PsiE family protein [Clostridia bacterium]|nr:phosphate-starvation-inducible PsiE family protein [Clostridia bacterium]
MKMSQLKSWIIRMTVYLELVLALFITAAIIFGMVDLVKYIVLILQTNPFDTYDVFQKFLGHVLLLVVGVELVAMLVMHTPGSVIEVLLYAVARNMLIGSKDTYDFILGIASIAGIFAIRKFLFAKSISESEDSDVFSAAANVTEINSTVGVNIPETLADTVGGIISYLSRQSCREIHEGVIFHVADAEIKVLSYRNGVILRVAVVKSRDE